MGLLFVIDANEDYEVVRPASEFAIERGDARGNGQLTTS